MPLLSSLSGEVETIHQSQSRETRIGGSRARLGRRLVAAVALLAVAALLLAPLPPGHLGPWQGKFLDFGHVPLFGALVLILRASLGPPLWRALLVALALAGFAELAQPLVGRSGGWLDFLRGGLGALAAAAAVRAFEERRVPMRAAPYAFFALALPVWPVVEVAPFVADTIEARREFPVLADFSSQRELLRWECQQAALTPHEGGARLDLFPGPSDFSFAMLRPAVADFGDYRWLCCEVHALGEPVDLVVSVRTGFDASSATTNAQAGARFAGGKHVARLDLRELARRGRPRPLDLSDVRYVILFSYQLRAPRTIILSRVWLEQ